MASRTTNFNKEWTDPTFFPQFSKWVRPVPGDDKRALCKMCRKSIDLSNMGSVALKSHMKAKKHKDLLSQRTITSAFVADRAPKASTGVTVQSLEPAIDPEAPSAVPASTEAAVPRPQSATQLAGQSTFASKHEVTAAELRWAAMCVQQHFSMSSCQATNEAFKLMFPDSDIARAFSCSRDKVAYLVAHGLGPFYGRQLETKLKEATHFVASFDEALNRVSQKGQFDIIVRFWDNGYVVNRYFTSVFLGHSRAADLLRAFTTALGGLQVDRMLQIGMDGPNVNWRFYEDFKTDLAASTERELLETGSCGLHILHGAFQTGNRLSDWSLNSVLSAMHRLFKDSPARRADFMRITGSSVFAKKFCSVRWAENVEVATRAIEILPSMKKYVDTISPSPNVESFRVLKEALREKLFGAKLEYFKSLANIIQPFVVRFQSPCPTFPFIFEALHALLRRLMNRFVKRDILAGADSASKLLKIDCKYGSPSIRVAKEIDLGFGAKQMIDCSGASQAEKLEFHLACLRFICGLTSKLIERCPLRHRMVRGASCLEPTLILNTPQLAASRMKVCLEELVNRNRVSSTAAEDALEQFGTFFNTTAATDTLKTFSANTSRLDSLYYSLMTGSSDVQALWSVVKIVVLLSSGNSAVESGFSINKDMLVENLKDNTLIAQRLAYDGIKAAGGAASMPIPADMVKFCRGARQRYRDALDAQRRTSAAENADAARKKQMERELAALESQKKPARLEASAACSSIDLQMAELRKQM